MGEGRNRSNPLSARLATVRETPLREFAWRADAGDGVLRASLAPYVGQEPVWFRRQLDLAICAREVDPPPPERPP